LPVPAGPARNHVVARQAFHVSSLGRRARDDRLSARIITRGGDATVSPTFERRLVGHADQRLDRGGVDISLVDRL
jgi:hypothetical protein